MPRIGLCQIEIGFIALLVWRALNPSFSCLKEKITEAAIPARCSTERRLDSLANGGENQNESLPTEISRPASDPRRLLLAGN
jgi:hypothetical protein